MYLYAAILLIQVLLSSFFQPSGHSLRHSPVTEFFTYRHALQLVAKGLLLEDSLHPSDI